MPRNIRPRKERPFTRVLRSFCASLLLVCTLLSLVPAAHAVSDPDGLTSEACLIYNIETDKILFEKAIDKPVYPTATVKIMTGLLALEYYQDDLDVLVPVTDEAISGVYGTTSINLVAGEEISARNLLYALLVLGANDAACVLAYNIGGNLTAFVNMMNERAQKIGCKNTVFTNCTGIHDDNMVTTARDMLKIAQYAYNNSNFMAMSSMDSYTIPATNKRYERILYNRNYIVSTQYYTKYYNSLAKGMCSGNTKEGGYCLVTTIRKSGCTYIIICMHSYFNEEENYVYSYNDCKVLIDWAYNNYDFVSVIDTTTMVCELPVTLSTEVDYVTLLPEQPVEMFLPRDVDVSTAVTLRWFLLSDSIEAPIKEGQIAGVLAVQYEDKLYATVDLVTKGNISRSEFLYFLSVIRNVVTSRPFFLCCIAALLIGIYYVLFTAVYRQKAKKRAEKRRQPNLTRR